MPPIWSTDPVILYTMNAMATVDMDVPRLESPWAVSIRPSRRLCVISLAGVRPSHISAAGT